MNRNLPVFCFTLLVLLALTVLMSNAQEAGLEQPQRVETSIGIYDVQSRNDIHKFSASEIRELIRLENGRNQGADTVPHPVLIYCFEEKIFRYTNGKYQDAEIKYRLHTPKNIRFGRKYPLVVHLHGIGEAGSDNISSLVHLHSVLPLMIGPGRQDFFMLVVQNPEETPGWFFRPSTQDGTLDVLVAAMEHVIRENPIDRRRITATGVSSGGWGVWELILRHPDIFAGAVPTACGAPHPTQRLAALNRTRIWSITNSGDGNSDSIRTAMQVVNSSGGFMGHTEPNVEGHNAWRPAMEDYNCFQWMLAQKRGSWFSPPPGVIVHNNPRPLLLAFVFYIVPIAIIVYLLWGRLCEWIPIVFQSIKGWCSRF